MADENTPAGEPPDEDAKLFSEFLEKVGPSWLKKQIDLLRPELTSETKAEARPVLDGLADFFRTQLEAEKKTTEKLREQLETLWETATPEQRTLLKSLRSGAGAAPQTPTAPPSTPEEPPKNPPPATARKAGFLKRL